MNEINDLIEQRRMAMQRDYKDGFLCRDEYIAIKAELIAIQGCVDSLADKFVLTPVEGK